MAVAFMGARLGNFDRKQSLLVIALDGGRRGLVVEVEVRGLCPQPRSVLQMTTKKTRRWLIECVKFVCVHMASPLRPDQ